MAAEGWREVAEIAAAFGLSSLIGLERELREKDAGLRTHTLVGTGSALFLLVGKYGFAGMTGVDESRVAAGVVTGIGFVGGGLIFVRGDAVRGLTTAAAIWMACAIGMACGAGLLRLALVAAAAHFVAVLGYPPVERLLARRRPSSRASP